MIPIGSIWYGHNSYNFAQRIEVVGDDQRPGFKRIKCGTAPDQAIQMSEDEIENEYTPEAEWHGPRL
jgi:hypothetical protein